VLPILVGSFLVYEIVQHEIAEAKKRAIARVIVLKLQEGERVLMNARKALGL
jgi:hypothetical protein